MTVSGDVTTDLRARDEWQLTSGPAIGNNAAGAVFVARSGHSAGAHSASLRMKADTGPRPVILRHRGLQDDLRVLAVRKQPLHFDTPFIDRAHFALEWVALHRRPDLKQFLNQQSLGWSVSWRQMTLDSLTAEKRDGLVAALEEALSGKAGG